jgi:RNA polymerase sigma-70 factor (ECF subfamily)
MWPESTATDKLLSRARQGDRTAVEDLLARHREPLRRLIALRMDGVLARRVDASDIVQEVLVEVNRRLADYLDNPVMPFHLWLRNIARDRIVDAHRRHRVAEKRSLDREQPLTRAATNSDSSQNMAAALVDPGLTPGSAVVREEFRQLFESAMERLDEDDREILLMRHTEQLSNQEAAAALSLSEAAAGMRYLRALRRLRMVLAPHVGADSSHE